MGLYDRGRALGARNLVGDPDPVAGHRVLHADGGVSALRPPSLRANGSQATADKSSRSLSSGAHSRDPLAPRDDEAIVLRKDITEKRAEPARLLVSSDEAPLLRRLLVHRAGRRPVTAYRLPRTFAPPP